MTSTDEIVAYESLCTVTGRMLEAARARDWERLCTLERDMSGLVHALSVADAAAAGKRANTDESTRMRKMTLIRQVLADDAAIRDLTEPWLREIGNLLRSNRANRSLSAAYGSCADPSG